MEQKKKKSYFTLSRQKSYLTAGVIALVAVIALAGIYYKNRMDQGAKEQEAVIMAEAEWTEDSVALDDGGATEEPKDEIDETQSGERAQSTVETMVSEEIPIVNFSESHELEWPIHGDVVINYSMDQSVYFATLDQYKYSPAIVIQGQVNDKVLASAAGQVSLVETTAETGETLTVDLGNGYQLTYGQLKDIQFQEGDFVEAGDLIGFVNEPTKYYSVEGSNLYFEMRKNGDAINPLEYLK